MTCLLKITDLSVSVGDKRILDNLNLSLEEGKTHALMGKNGSGKSTLAQVIMGNPLFEINSGKIIYQNNDLIALPVEQRALSGIFLSFQYPSEVSGVTVASYLRLIYNKKHGQNISPVKFREILKVKMEILKIKEDFLNRYLNEGFSGGEKKKMEMLQMLLLEPKVAILDEVDSGLDIDAIKIVAFAVNYLKENFHTTVLIITHYSRILKFIPPDFVHIINNGAVTRTGGSELLDMIEEHGYSKLL